MYAIVHRVPSLAVAQDQPFLLVGDRLSFAMLNSQTADLSCGSGHRGLLPHDALSSVYTHIDVNLINKYNK